MSEQFAPTPELIRMAQQAKAKYDAEQNGEECKHIPDQIKKKRTRVTAVCTACGSDLVFIKGAGPLPTMWMAMNNVFNRNG